MAKRIDLRTTLSAGCVDFALSFAGTHHTGETFADLVEDALDNGCGFDFNIDDTNGDEIAAMVAQNWDIVERAIASGDYQFSNPNHPWGQLANIAEQIFVYRFREEFLDAYIDGSLLAEIALDRFNLYNASDELVEQLIEAGAEFADGGDLDKTYAEWLEVAEKIWE